MKRILCGIDGSGPAREAAAVASDLARSLDAELELVYVAPIFAPLGPEDGAYFHFKHEQEEEAQGEAALREVGAFCTSRGARVHTHLTRGTPEGELVRLGYGADLLVVGHRGRNAVARALLGSVADTVAQRAPCPVIIVRAGTAPVQLAAPVPPVQAVIPPADAASQPGPTELRGR